jgi:hypothetical protein
VPRKSAEAIAGEYWRRSKAPPPPPHPEQPACLSPAAARYWREIIVTREPTYFDAANRVLLECMCNHMATADVIWGEINKLDVGDPRQFRRYRALGVMACREGRSIISLMTKLRLWPPKAHAPAASSIPWKRELLTDDRKPWEPLD